MGRGAPLNVAALISPLNQVAGTVLIVETAEVVIVDKEKKLMFELVLRLMAVVPTRGIFVAFTTNAPVGT